MAETIDQLNLLIQINKDCEAAFLTASKNINNTELETMFDGYARQHAKFASEIQSEVERLGGRFSESGSVGGAVQRGWMDLKSAISGHSARAILGSCKGGEESAQHAYDDAVDDNPSGQTHLLLARHQQQVKEIRTRIARLFEETKDGVEFQENDPRSSDSKR